MAKSANEVLGYGRCAIGCRSTRAKFCLSGKGLAYCTCDSCNMQAFARSGRSDEVMRGKILTTERPEKVEPAAPEPVREITAADPVRETAPAAIDPSPETAMDPPKKKRVHGWGVLAGQEY